MKEQRGYYKLKEIGIYETRRYNRNPRSAIATFMSDRRDYDARYFIDAVIGKEYLIMRLANETEYKAYSRLPLSERLKIIINAYKLFI